MARVGEPITFDASKSEAANEVRWDLGDGTIATEATVSHVYAKPGFYRVGLTICNGQRADLDWRDLYVVDGRDELGTDAAAWSWSDPASKVRFSADPKTKLVGEASILAEVGPYGGGRVGLVCEATGDRPGHTLVFWIRAQNPNMPAWQGPNPVVTLTAEDGTNVVLTPKKDLLAQPSHNEAREGWTYVAVPLNGDGLWAREGGELRGLKSITLGLDSWGSDPLKVWIDGLAIRER